MVGILLGAEWAWFQGFENLSTVLSTKVLMAQLTYVGIYGCVPFFLLFTFKYIGKERWTTTKWVVSLLIVPLIVILLCWTNQYHFLIWSGFVFNPDDGSNLVIFLRGPLYWIGVIYNYILFMVICYYLIINILSARGLLRQQTVMLALGTTPVLISNILYIFARDTIRGYDFSPIGFAMMGSVFFLGIKRLRLFSVYPIPPSAILDGLSNGVVVIDNMGIIVDCNPASEKFIVVDRHKAIGMPVSVVFKPIPGLEDVRMLISGIPFEFLDPSDQTVCTLTSQVLKRPVDVEYGRMLTFSDVSKYKQIESVEKEHRELAEAYRDVMVAMTSTLDFDTVLDQIMANIQRVMPNTMTNLVLIGEDDIGRVVRSFGYKEHGLQDWVNNIEFRMDEVATFRKMIETRKPIIVNDTHADDSWISKVENIHSYLGAPIHVKDRTLGFINQDNPIPNVYTDDQAMRMQTFADLAAIALENARLFKRTQEMAIQDDLTSLYNRRHFFSLAFSETKRSLRFDYPCSLVIFDVDNFKTINDRYGHPMGDQV